MTFILVSLMIIIFIVYYLERFQGTETPKEITPEKPALTVPTPQVQSIYPPSQEKLAQDIQNIEHMRIPQPLMDFNLINSGEGQVKVNELLAIIKSMPRPHSMLRSLTKGEMESSEKLYELVKKDPEIAAKILHTVNSSGFYLSQKITQLNHAILYLGTNLVKNIALQCIVRTQSEHEDPGVESACDRVWATGFLASSLTFLFAKNLEFKNASELATQTLLTYIGNLAIISYRPDLAYCFTDSLFNRTVIEQRELGVNSALIGGELATAWQLPPPIIDSIKNSLLPLGVPPTLCNVPKEHLREIVLCYSCCRIAEEVTNKKLSDMADVNLINPEQMEFFYLPEYFDKTGLKGLLFLKNKPAFRNEANKLIEKIESVYSNEQVKVQ